MDLRYAIFNLVWIAIIIGASLWLRRRVIGSGVPNAPVGRLMVLTATYGIAIYVFLTILLFFDDTLASNTAVDPATAVGSVFEMAVALLYVYVLMIAPVVMLIIGVVSFLKKGDSIYPRLVYLGCAGYTFMLFVLLILMTSRCGPPTGGPP